MKKLLFLLLIVPVILLLGFWGRLHDRRKFERAFSGALQSALHTNGSIIEIAGLTPFSWDAMFSFHPYTQSSEIDSQLGVKWHNNLKKEIEYSDNYTLLIFTKAGKVVQHAKIARSLCNWDLDNRNGFSPREAVFLVKSNRQSYEIVLEISHTNTMSTPSSAK